jgi:hypothetical protein
MAETEQEIIFDELNIAYRTLSPQPFDGGKFFERISQFFQKRAVRGFSVSPDGVAAQIDSIYTLKTARLNVDLDSGIVGVTGKLFADVNEGFDILIRVLDQEVRFDIESIRYLEVTGKGRYRSDSIPISKMKSSYASDFTKRVSEFFQGSEVSPLTLRVGTAAAAGSKGSLRDLLDWEEFKLEPLTVNPNYYYWELVSRHSDQRRVRALWQELPTRVTTLLNSVG